MPTVRARSVLQTVTLCMLAGQPQGAVREWKVDTEFVDLHARESDGAVPLFSAPRFGATLLNGTLVVGDADSRSILFFQGDGEFLRTIARRGEGPGEFRVLSWVGSCDSDSVYAYDATLQRLTVFDATGRFSRSIRVPSSASSVPTAQRIACGAPGEFVALGKPQSLEPTVSGQKVVRPAVAVYTFDGEGRVLRVFGNVAGDEWVWFGMGVGPRPLGVKTMIALGREGLIMAASDSAEVKLLGRSGQVVGVVALPFLKRPATEADVAKALDAILETAPAGGLRDELRRHYEALPPPGSLPVIEYSVAGADRSLVLVGSSRASLSPTAIVVGDNGSLLGQFRVPGGHTLLGLGRDRAIMLFEDTSGVVRVRAFRVEKR